MIVSMVYQENARLEPRRAGVDLQPDGRWKFTALHGDRRNATIRVLRDRREAMQMARRWVETGEL